MAGWIEQEQPRKALPKITIAEKELLEGMSDLDTEKPAFKGAVYGDMGTGKTVHALKMAQAFTPPEKFILYVDTKENWSSLLNHPELRRRVKKLAFINWEQLMVMARAFRAGQEPFKSRFGAVVIDEYNSAIQHDLSWIVRARSKQNEIDNAGFKDPFQPTQPDYLASQIRSNDLIDLLVKTPELNVFLTSHEKLDESTMTTRPDMKPGAATDFQKALHSVYRSSIDEVKLPDGKGTKLVHKLQLQPVKRVAAKNRIGGLGVYATTEMVIEAYNKWGLDNDKSKEQQEEKSNEVKEEVSEQVEANSEDSIESLLD